MDSIKNVFIALTQSEQGQFSLSLVIILNLIWIFSWIISISKYFVSPRMRTRRKKDKSTFSLILYCRRKAKPWSDSVPEIMDYVMLILNSILMILIAAAVLADFLFKN